jgi:hypothetical protein
MSISSVSSNSFMPPTSTNDTQQRQQDFLALQNAIQTGDIAGAKTALAAFQQDLQTSQKSGSTTPSQDLQNLQNALSSNDVEGARKAFALFLQDVKQAKTHHHHHKHNSQAADSSTAATDNTSTNNSDASAGVNVTV